MTINAKNPMRISYVAVTYELVSLLNDAMTLDRITNLVHLFSLAIFSSQGIHATF